MTMEMAKLLASTIEFFVSCKSSGETCPSAMMRLRRKEELGGE
jgi:hypothetical protein